MIDERWRFGQAIRLVQELLQEVSAMWIYAAQMRYLQALAEVAADKNSTIIFPLPIELLRPFLGTGRDGATAPARTNERSEAASREVKNPAQSAQTTEYGAIAATVLGNGR
jgi:hypothetical protein